MHFVACTAEEHAAALLDILNHEILTSTSLYDYRPRTLASMQSWFEAKRAAGRPLIGAVDDAGRLLGFASYGTFRSLPAYKYTAEHSIYVHPDCRSRGVGRALLTRLIEAARDQQLHLLVGVIDMANSASIALHESLGFTHAGTLSQAGFKFGHWLDVGFFQRTLDTPAHPVDG
ncbi:GNAT family N-acetyltransferase [Methyloversatilis thermotolerans]|uniref:GNAT family N-acetyltransferase n=1 Tax=Methyloversatilis thermotolerans TaxID=1346290 RepID=UPI000380614F|nr:GNAT family N-acetyltransferase [Methyloversatilis thermotolerans]